MVKHVVEVTETDDQINDFHVRFRVEQISREIQDFTKQGNKIN